VPGTFLYIYYIHLIWATVLRMHRSFSGSLIEDTHIHSWAPRQPYTLSIPVTAVSTGLMRLSVMIHGMFSQLCTIIITQEETKVLRSGAFYCFDDYNRWTWSNPRQGYLLDLYWEDESTYKRDTAVYGHQ